MQLIFHMGFHYILPLIENVRLNKYIAVLFKVLVVVFLMDKNVIEIRIALLLVEIMCLIMEKTVKEELTVGKTANSYAEMEG